LSSTKIWLSLIINWTCNKW